MELLIQYKVKEDKVEEQVEAAKKFVESIKGISEGEINYTVYQMNDKVSFKHIAQIASEEAKARLQSQDFFKEFAEGLKERAAEQPTVTPFAKVSSTKE